MSASLIPFTSTNSTNLEISSHKAFKEFQNTWRSLFWCEFICYVMGFIPNYTKSTLCPCQILREGNLNSVFHINGSEDSNIW